MDVYDFLGFLTNDDAKVAIYDLATGEEVFCGEASEAIFCGYGEYEVMSFDLCPQGSDPRGVLMVINIETDEDEDESEE